MSNVAMTKGGKGGGLRSYLESPEVRAKLAEVASAAMKPEALVRLALMAASRQPDLLKCSQTSILRALIDAAELGIKPGGVQGRGYLVPRLNRATREMECCFDPGWRGLIDIARRTGKIKRIEAHVVYEADEFRVTRSPLTTIFHEPAEEGDPGGIRAAYAVAEFIDGSIQIEVLWRRDLEKIRNTSAAKGGPWATWPDEMSRKSAVRRLCKYLPFDPQLERALEHATAAEREDDAPHIEMVPAPPARTGLADRIRAKRVAQTERQPEEAESPAEADHGEEPAVVEDPYAPRSPESE